MRIQFINNTYAWMTTDQELALAYHLKNKISCTYKRKYKENKEKMCKEKTSC